jgi:hypothetical protein
MEAQSFARSLRALVRRTPFIPFTVEFVSGERIEVDHPEALAFRDGVALYVSPDHTPILFDNQGVSRLIGATDQAASA